MIPVTNVHFRVVEAATMADPHEYNMSGVKVKFPHKAYPSQVQHATYNLCKFYILVAGGDDVQDCDVTSTQPELFTGKPNWKWEVTCPSLCSTCMAGWSEFNHSGVD